MLKQLFSAAALSAMLTGPALSLQLPYDCDSNQDEVLRLDYYKAGSNGACGDPRACLFWDNLHMSPAFFSSIGGPIPLVSHTSTTDIYEGNNSGQVIEFVKTASGLGSVRIARMTRDGPNFFMTCRLQNASGVR